MREKKMNKNGKIITKIFLMCFLCMICCGRTVTVNAQPDPVNEAKQGVVEVYSGFTDDKGVFHKLQNASGFVIQNQEDSAFVITTYNTLKNSEEVKKEYCKKHKIAMDGYSFNDTVQVVVKGDVTVPAAILNESEKQNFSILQIEESINERKALKLGTAEGLTTGDVVYALGFSDDAGENDDVVNRHTEFSALDVEVVEGHVQDSGANRDGILHLQHSAVISEGNTGGPLLNKDGYVVGLNNVVLNEEDFTAFYSLPIDEIREILDNFNIRYDSKEQEASFNDLKKMLAECEQIISGKEYKTKSKEALRIAIEETKNIAVSENADIVQIETALKTLNDAKKQLVLKMTTTRKIIIVFGVVIGIMAVILIRLILWNRNNKQNSEITEDIEAKQNLIVEDDMEEKTVLFENKIGTIRCIRTGQTVLLDKAEISIGKKEENDLVIADNGAISRKHACIYRENSVYFIKDMESANGTIVNGINVEPGSSLHLIDGDIIMLADEKLVFAVGGR